MSGAGEMSSRSTAYWLYGRERTGRQLDSPRCLEYVFFFSCYYDYLTSGYSTLEIRCAYMRDVL
jgi:hypothetical protein